MSDTSRLEAVYKDLEKEHRRILKLIERLRGHDSLDGLESLLDQLRTLVIVHFAREQLPDGFYELLGARAETRHEQMQALIADHGAILATLNALLEDVKNADTSAGPNLLEQTTQLTEQLYEHEHREHDFASAALGRH